MNFERLSNDDSRQNYGILCHRQYADRIRQALIPSSSDDWLKLSSDTDTRRTKQMKLESRKCEVIPTPEEKGPRKSRTGYSLLVIQGAVMSPADLPPMARKQISWAGRLTHQSLWNEGTNCNGNIGNATIESNAITDLQSMLKVIISEIWSELSKSFDLENDFLRLDIQPKSFNSEVCTAFTAFTNGMDMRPIRLARSALKVSHAVNMTIQSTLSFDMQSPTIHKIFWGISKNKDHFEDLNQRLNDYATSEVILEPTESKTGLDSHSSEAKKVPWDAPVSRAYYKLAQVFEDDNLLRLIPSLHNNKETLDSATKSILSHGAGLDIGASPGGWTQVLHNTLDIPTVVALDPGTLAQRVTSLKGVHHLRAELTTQESIKFLAYHAPYSVIVCDASVSNANELLVKIADTLDRVLSLLRKPDNSNDNCSERSVFALPLCLIITLKLPYKTKDSIDRNLEKVNKYFPDYLRRIALLGSSHGDNDVVAVDVWHKISHLFANSISERTMLAVFDKK